MASALDTSVAQHLLTLVTKLPLLAVSRCANRRRLLCIKLFYCDKHNKNEHLPPGPTPNLSRLIFLTTCFEYKSLTLQRSWITSLFNQFLISTKFNKLKRFHSQRRSSARRTIGSVNHYSCWVRDECRWRNDSYSDSNDSPRNTVTQSLQVCRKSICT